jgi:hypothetical protein
MKHRRLIQAVIAVSVTGAALLGGELIAQATSATTHFATATPGAAAAEIAKIPNQVQVLGPNGVVEGTVPKSDLIGDPSNGTPGTPVPAAAQAGASVVLDGQPGYPVTKNGALVGYWCGPEGFVSVSSAESKGAVPADGQGPVGTN